MIEFFDDNIHSFWFAIGFLLLALEAVAFGFSTGFVLFVGLAALLTGSLLWFNVVPPTWLASIATFALTSVIVSALLWKPLKRLQGDNKAPQKDNTSDLIGLKFRLEKTITADSSGVTRYSGIEWKVEIDLESKQNEIAAGNTVVVVAVDAGRFSVISLEEYNDRGNK